MQMSPNDLHVWLNVARGVYHPRLITRLIITAQINNELDSDWNAKWQ